MKKKLLASLFITPVLAVLASTQVLAGNEDLAHCIELYPSQEHLQIYLGRKRPIVGTGRVVCR